MTEPLSTMLDRVNLSLGASAVFYIIIGLWWHMQITKKYWHAKCKKTEFKSSVTFPCCHRFGDYPVEGIVKLVGSIGVSAMCIYQIRFAQVKSVQYGAIGQLTVFVLFVVSALCDILSQRCKYFKFPNLDHLLLVISFNVQSIVLSYHADLNSSWLAVADTCAMFAATGVAVVVLFEIRFSDNIWLPLARAYCTLLLGTWFFHIVLVCSIQSIPAIDVTNTTSSSAAINTTLSTPDEIDMLSFSSLLPNSYNRLLVPMHFTWHCFFNLNFLTVMWVVVYKMASKNWCVCVPGDDDSLSRFENRVHFDYHMIDRATDSDLE